MNNPLWTDIHLQPSNLTNVIEHLYGVERSRLEAAAAFLKNERPIAFVGVASAEYLCMPAEIYLGQHGRYASVMCASDAGYSLVPALRNANVVINSRSGETIEVVKLAAALKQEGIPFVLLTNEPDSTTARLATYVVWANTHKDDLVSINVVTSMMTATLLLAAAVVGELDAIRPDVDRLVLTLGEVVGRAGQAAGEIYALMKDIRPIYLLYRGHSKGAANCGRLVMEEVSRRPGIAMEAAEFRQGPNEVIDEQFGAAVFVGMGKQGDLNRALRADILRSGGRVLTIGEVEGLVPAEKEVLFPITGLPDCLRPVCEVVPLQFLAYSLAQGQGYAPGEVRYISKVILTEEGIPNQA